MQTLLTKKQQHKEASAAEKNGKKQHDYDIFSDEDQDGDQEKGSPFLQAGRGDRRTEHGVFLSSVNDTISTTSWKSVVVLVLAAVGVTAAYVAISSPSSSLGSSMLSFRNLSFLSSQNINDMVDISADNGFNYGASLNASMISMQNVNTAVAGSKRGVFSDACTPDSLCLDGSSYCNTQLDEPIKGYCYECLNDNHCDVLGEYCRIDKYNAICTATNVDRIPSIDTITRGYNIYNADPFLGKKDALIDSGYAKQFYRHTFIRSADRKISLRGKDFYFPLGFSAFPLKTKKEVAETTSFSSTMSFKSEVASSVSVGGSGTAKGIEFGGQVGASAYAYVAVDASAEVVTVKSMAWYALYNFNIPSIEGINLKLTGHANETLTHMKDIPDSWSAFFEDYGTHIITQGIMGAWEKISLRFTSEEQNIVKGSGSSFESSVSVGMPFLFSFSNENTRDVSEEVGKRIQQTQGNTETTVMGDPENLNDSPSAIRMNLESICLFIDFNKYKNINEATCFQNMKSYCISKLLDIGVGNGHCEYADDKTFQCITDSHCGNDPWKRCDNGKCVTRECLVNTDCDTPHWDVCEEGGFCVRRKSEPDPSKISCSNIIHYTGHRWNSGCRMNPRCAAGFRKVADDNSRCWYPSTGIVCAQFWRYWGPPCNANRPLLGTCGNGKRGNGCCDSGEFCSSITGICSSDSYGMKTPSRAQCKVMTGK